MVMGASVWVFVVFVRARARRMRLFDQNGIVRARRKREKAGALLVVVVVVVFEGAQSVFTQAEARAADSPSGRSPGRRTYTSSILIPHHRHSATGLLPTLSA
jgi:hypothetical protein